MEETNIINNEYDFSNIVVDIEHLEGLIRFLDGLNKQLKKLADEDEEKNKQFKEEYKEYKYKETFGQGLDIYIKYESFSSNITCKDFESFESAVKNGNIKNLRGIDIKLCLDFKRGNGSNLVDYDNLFKITFEPYNITFIRKSNHNDEIMDQIEKKIVATMNQFQVINTIFCSK